MCGIVGLLVKKPAMRQSLGKMMLPMLTGMTERGPDSAGLVVFSEPSKGDYRKYSVYGGLASSVEWYAFIKGARKDLGRDAKVKVDANHAVVHSIRSPDQVKKWLRDEHPKMHLLSVGKRIDLYKDVGAPADIADRYHFSDLQGTHLVGHTRMATESAVTPSRAHPFTAGEDFCLVHNGSLSNPFSIRRQLEPLGIVFETDNDTEAACRFLEWRMREGDTLQVALEKGFDELDGFFTFLMGTKDELALVRDPFACKPAVVAETDDYVAIASEFRSLAHLPGIKNAEIFEPAPERIYVWKA